MLHLKNTVYIDPVEFKMTQTDIFAEEGHRGKIHFSKPAEAKIAETLDCKGQFVTKSFAVGHHHIYSALAKGMPAPKKIPENFNEILQYVWWTLDKSLDADSIKASAYTAGIEAAKAGASFIIDHHASPNCIEGSLDIISEALDELGLGHLLCYEITDRDGKDKAEAGINESENNLKKQQGLVGLHASFTVGDESLKKAAELMKTYNTGAHIHVAEAEYDEQHCQKDYGMSVIERLHKFGLLDSPKTLIIHGLHLNNKERELLKNSPAWVVQNTESNLNNNVGFFKSEGLSKRIMMGTDGMHGDMLRSAQAAFFAGQPFDNIDFPEAYRRFRNTDQYINKNGFEGYADNNLVVLDYPTGTPLTKDNFLGHFIFGLRAAHVRHTVSQGKLVVKDRKIQGVNEDEILAFSQEQAKKLWTKMAK
jgi:cytosine/adenosine deaminase-related metal-dependent hydrolase